MATLPLILCFLFFSIQDLLVVSISPESLARIQPHGDPDYVPPHRHDFPQKDSFGKDVTNELQLIEFWNIVDAKNIKQSLGVLSREKSHLAATSTYQITSVSPLVIKNDDVVTVKYYASKTDHYDWIGAYSPANVDITTTVPVKFGYCDHDPSYITTGSGQLHFNLTNLRADVAFYYFSGGTKYPVKQNVSTSKVTFSNFNEQLRPRIVATGNPDQLKMLWSSYNSTNPVAKWGTSSGQYSNIISATTSQILKSQMQYKPANSTGWRDLGLIHTALFTGMADLANTKVYYTFGDQATNTWSEREYILFVPPLAGTQPPTRPTTVVLFDDLGRGSTDDTYTWNEYGRPSINTTLMVGAEIAAGGVDMIYHGGDISYATGYIAVWDFFMDMLVPMSASTVYLTTVGNHESDCPHTSTLYETQNDSGGECGILTTDLLPMPYPAKTDRPWWSYDVGLIHFVGMSTEHNYSIGSEQWLFLEQDLANVNRTKTPWVIFGGHRAMYINSNYGGTISSDITVMNSLILNIEPLLWKYRVNLAFWGHNHVVQRMTAVLNKTVVQKATISTDSDGSTVYHHNDPQATVHFVIGTGGAKFTTNYVYPFPSWNELVFYRYGYARVVAVNATYLDWKWRDSGDGKIYDHVVFTQGDATQPWSNDFTPVPTAAPTPALSDTSADGGILSVKFLVTLTGGSNQCINVSASGAITAVNTSFFFYPYASSYASDFYVSISSHSLSSADCIQVGGYNVKKCNFLYKWPTSFNSKYSGKFSAVVSVQNALYGNISSSDYTVCFGNGATAGGNALWQGHSYYPGLVTLSSDSSSDNNKDVNLYLAIGIPVILLIVLGSALVFYYCYYKPRRESQSGFSLSGGVLDKNDYSPFHDAARNDLPTPMKV